MIAPVEIQVEQKKRLFMLLKIRARNKNITIADLDDMVLAVKAEMQQEDVAWVEKIIAEL